MLPVEEMQHHSTSERLVEILCEKTQSTNTLFFRVLVGFHFSLLASQMRCFIKTHDRGDIPVNMYALNLATSGAGKGFSTNIIENQVVNNFRERFMETFEAVAEPHLKKLAFKRAARQQTDEEEELQRTIKEFKSLGQLVFSFDSGTPAAVKQMRHKLLMADAGSVNLIIDEIGSNLTGQVEVLTAFLELFDVGLIKQKLTKNTNENIRGEEIIGRTPTNMMLFGTPTKLLNGGKVEEELNSMLETGYARRCFFGFAKEGTKDLTLTPEQVYDLMTNSTTNDYLEDLSSRLEQLADMSNMRKQLIMSKETSLLLIEYKLSCERKAALLADHEETRKAEISHRYFKALKLAGAYAFVDDALELTETHLYAAIKVAEESGEAFEMLLSRDRPYVKLARYIASVGKELTQADLVEDLPYYRGAMGQKAEMMTLCTAWGYKNNIIIKKSYTDGIEFFKGETLKENDMSGLIVSYTNKEDMTSGYTNERSPWDKLHRLTQLNGFHWINHHLQGGYREESNAIMGFNMIVLDIDGTMSLSTAQLLLKDYKALYYTTKSHTDESHRYRIVLPINYELKMDAKEYKEFFENVIQGLPFDVDESCTHRCKKWQTFKGQYEYTEGELFDVLPFIPKTSKNEERKQRLDSQHQMDNLERWVLNNSGDGNRNNMLLKYGMILVDAGFAHADIHSRVMALNDKMPDKLDELEILKTIMVSVGKAVAARS